MSIRKTVVKATIFLMAIAASSAIFASEALGANLVSLRNGTVYDKSGNKMTNNVSSYKYASGSPVCPVSSVIAPTGQQAYAGNFDFLTYYFKNRKQGVATVVIRGNHSKGFKDAIILKYKIGGAGKSSTSRSNSSDSSSTSGSTSNPSSVSASTLSIASASVTIADQTYSGSALSPSATLVLNGKTLSKGTDYTIAYSDNVNAGTATATITGKNKYKGTVTKTFRIYPAQLSIASISGIENKTYTGAAIRLSPALRVGGNRALTNNVDYTTSYSNNTGVGTATVTFSGKGNYKGTVTRTYKIGQAPIKNASIANVSKSYAYTGSAIKPSPKINYSGKTLKSGRDYTVAYKANTNTGTATLTVKGKGNYSGSATKTFKIAAIPISKAKLSGIDASYYYAGSEVKPSPTLKFGKKILKAGADYTVSYKNNKKPGTATLTIKGKGNYNGSKTVNFKMINMGSATVKKVDGNGYSHTITFMGKTFKLYKQGKGSYKKIQFGSSKANRNAGKGTVSNNGCGPSSLSIALSGNGVNKNPGTVAQACTAQSRVDDRHPSAPQNMAVVARQYGATVKVHKHSADVNTVKKDVRQALLRGHQLVIYVGQPAPEKYYRYFTGGIHWISVLSIDPVTDKVYVGNPGGRDSGWYPLDTLVRAHTADKQWNGCYGAWLEIGK